ncbi:MAG: hypothetical protein D6768_05965 [Chloroflexi bacterium]|nr:MAG: hypothetical protein D6768_05965 [Chloroflexota bacterium]
MHMVVLRLVWPYVLRYIAQYGADFLQQRRERALAAVEAVIEAKENPAPAECPPCPPCPPCPEEEESPVVVTAASQPAGGGNAVWFALSGILLGAAFGLMGYLFLRDNRI